MNIEQTPIISFVANSGTGKTTLLEKLVRDLKAMGFTVGVIKHDAHRFEIDVPGKDSYRMTAAGADSVAILSEEKMAMVCRTETMMDMDEVIARMPQADILLTEGFRFKETFPRIEVFRAPKSETLLSKPEHLLAVAANAPGDAYGKPVFDLDDDAAIAEFIAGYIKEFREKRRN